ncbi:rab11 family-interacting protein 5 isoform X4 [Channa argus]|uniref:rab11 family-interacting protein 5 isoform X4 n=1 Tax=Channa argus TaxID=215402 RepID=UPI0035200E0B
MSSLRVEEDQKWAPTHVQVTVLRGRGLRGKGKHGTSDVYTIIQLGKEKYSTCVVEKTTEPEWKEECTFELQPGVLERAGGSGCPAGSNELVLTVMHRALIGLDVFLGQTVIQLDKVFHESRFVKNEWYRLNSKTGKKEKERGDIQVTVLFTRNNLTASMYDLVMKDKDTSTFSKLKERMKGKRRSSDEDSSSAVLPSGYGSLYRMRQRLPSDGGGEEDYEDDEGGEVRRSKMRTFFLRGKLRKSSDTRSSTSLGSESSESSSRGGSLSPTAGISVVVSDLSNSPSNSSNLTADNSPEHTGNTSPKSASLKCEFGHEAGEISIAVPQPTLCVNGSHAYNVHSLDPGSGKPEGSLGLGLLQKSMPLSMSLQNLSPRASTDLHKGPVGDGRRWSFDKPGEEEKAAIVAALEQSGPMLGEKEEPLGRAAPPEAASTVESESQGKKQRRNLFSHGRGESAGKGQSQLKDESEQAPTATEEKQKGWFGSKDSHSKPSPHPVKPLTTAMQVEEKRTEGRSVLATGLEKLKSTISPGRSSQLSEHETDRKKNPADDQQSLTEGAGSYYHLTHSELVALLLHREAELERQKAKFERQKVLLAKQELELKKLKPQVRDLEDYIDTLLVRIMEQKPTLLQVRSKLK